MVQPGQGWNSDNDTGALALAFFTASGADQRLEWYPNHQWRGLTRQCPDEQYHYGTHRGADQTCTLIQSIPSDRLPNERS